MTGNTNLKKTFGTTRYAPLYFVFRIYIYAFMNYIYIYIYIYNMAFKQDIGRPVGNHFGPPFFN